MSLQLSQAQEDRHRRAEELELEQIDSFATQVCEVINLATSVPNFKQVTPGEKAKLRGLLRYYRKFPHPFTKCVADNTKRFGKERAEKVCAVLKDLMKGTTKWRKGASKTNASEPEACPINLIDEELADLLERLSTVDYHKALGLEGE